MDVHDNAGPVDAAKVPGAKFNLDEHLIKLYSEIPFFACILRHINKVPSTTVPTAAVSYDEKSDMVTLLYNPDYMASLSGKAARGTLIHEVYHVVCGHLNERRRTPAKRWNWATDLAINSLIEATYKDAQTDLSGDSWLPYGVLIPGKPATKNDGSLFSEEEKKKRPVISLIESLPPLHSSEFYFDQLAGQEGQDGDDDGGVGTVDSHDFWDSIPEDKREFVRDKIKYIVGKATKVANSSQKGWGSIPADIVREITASVESTVDWRSQLLQFAGNSVKLDKMRTLRRIDKRFPMVYGGPRSKRTGRLLIAVDQSGSVSDDLLAQFSSELSSLTKILTIDVLPFDSEARQEDVYQWNRGRSFSMTRTKCGGTSFEAVNELVNSDKNRGRWDGVLILTDGECFKPGASRVKRAWVLGKDNTLGFTTEELQIKIGQRASGGAWR